MTNLIGKQCPSTKSIQLDDDDRCSMPAVGKSRVSKVCQDILDSLKFVENSLILSADLERSTLTQKLHIEEQKLFKVYRDHVRVKAPNYYIQKIRSLYFIILVLGFSEGEKQQDNEYTSHQDKDEGILNQQYQLKLKQLHKDTINKLQISFALLKLHIYRSESISRTNKKYFVEFLKFLSFDCQPSNIYGNADIIIKTINKYPIIDEILIDTFLKEIIHLSDSFDDHLNIAQGLGDQLKLECRFVMFREFVIEQDLQVTINDDQIKYISSKGYIEDLLVDIEQVTQKCTEIMDTSNVSVFGPNAFNQIGRSFIEELDQLVHQTIQEHQQQSKQIPVLKSSVQIDPMDESTTSWNSLSHGVQIKPNQGSHEGNSKKSKFTAQFLDEIEDDINCVMSAIQMKLQIRNPSQRHRGDRLGRNSTSQLFFNNIGIFNQVGTQNHTQNHTHNQAQAQAQNQTQNQAHNQAQNQTQNQTHKRDRSYIDQNMSEINKNVAKDNCPVKIAFWPSSKTNSDPDRFGFHSANVQRVTQVNILESKNSPASLLKNNDKILRQLAQINPSDIINNYPANNRSHQEPHLKVRVAMNSCYSVHQPSNSTKKISFIPHHKLSRTQALNNRDQKLSQTNEPLPQKIEYYDKLSPSKNTSLQKNKETILSQNRLILKSNNPEQHLDRKTRKNIRSVQINSKSSQQKDVLSFRNDSETKHKHKLKIMRQNHPSTEKYTEQKISNNVKFLHANPSITNNKSIYFSNSEQIQHMNYSSICQASKNEYLSQPRLYLEKQKIKSRNLYQNYCNYGKIDPGMRCAHLKLTNKF